MKILYAIQGTGNGHICRARDIIPALQSYGAVDILVSGTQADVPLPYEIKYRLQGLSFIFGKKGGINYADTYKKSNLKKLFKEMRSLPVKEYDLVLTDFEPVSAWACALKNKPCTGLSHQIGVLSKNAPKPEKTDFLGKAVLKYYAPVTQPYGFHFLPYDNHVFTPVIRKEVRNLTPRNNGHYTVYLPSFNDERIVRFLSHFPLVKWQVFSKHNQQPLIHHNVSVYPIHHEHFLKSLAGAEGVICGAGFETPAEVLYLQKKLLVVPMKGQYEQQCNAAALKTLGIPVLKNLKTKGFEKVQAWIESGEPVALDFPDETEYLVEKIIQNAKKAKHPDIKKEIDTPGRFSHLLLKKIFSHPKG